jgi:hypothetical protein
VTQKINGVALGAVSAGALFVYAGVKGYSVPHALQSLIQGKPPATGGQAYPVGVPSGAASGSPGTGGTVPAGASYNQAQLASLWQLAGGSPGSARNAACHAMQESSGNARVTSSNPDGGTNVGLWQLDTKGVGAGHTIAELQDPLTNARITVSATNDGRNWSEWATPGC